MKKSMQKGLYVLALGGMITMGSCKKDKDQTPSYTVPTTYNFDNVEYKDGAARVSMSLAFGAYLGKATSRQLNQDTINNLWNNANTSYTAELVVNYPYAFDALNASGLNIAGKMNDAATFKAYADSMVLMSQNRNATASQGVAGKIVNRLVNYTGLEFNQLVVKGFFGGMSMANVITLLNKVPNDDNNTVVAGSGTAMQHDWDLAFGYIGLPKDYDSAINYTVAPYNTNPARPLGIGGYFFERARPIKAGGIIFEAFRKGRAAINAKDYGTRDAAIATIKEYLEKTLAASADAYLALSSTRGGDVAARFHDYSEALGFTLALKYRPASSKLTDANYQVLLTTLKTDYWTLNDTPATGETKGKITKLRDILSAAYGKLD
ncbi:MAG: DUF4856 domain-containing protein [Filimonas sp.]|nr:DUF4856 domain-containing protein [Filimonas sp.]